MTLLGQFCLWLALFTALWGAGAAFFGRPDRPDLARTAVRSRKSQFSLTRFEIPMHRV